MGNPFIVHYSDFSFFFLPSFYGPCKNFVVELITSTPAASVCLKR